MALEQKTHELRAKQQTIGKLEQEVLHHIKEAELARARESDSIEAVERRAKREAESMEGSIKELKTEMIKTYEASEAYRQRAADLEAEVSSLRRLEAKLRESDKLLEDRQLRIDELRAERRAAEEALQDAQRNDQTKVLEGRLEAVILLSEQSAARAEAAEAQLAQKGGELDNVAVEKSRLEEECHNLKRSLGAKDVTIASLKSQIDDWSVREKETTERMKSLMSAKEVAADAAMQRENQLQHVIDALRDELRAEHRSKSEIEVMLAQYEAAHHQNESKHEQMKAELDRESEYRKTVNDKLRKLQREVEDRDAALAKEEVITRSLRSELEQQKSLSSALRSELETMRDTIRSIAAERDDAQSECARLEGIEEKLSVMRGIFQRQGEDFGQSTSALQETKERLAEAESLIQRLEALQVELRDVRRDAHVKGEAIDIALRDKKVLEEQLNELSTVARMTEGQLKITEAKLVAERERRTDVERRVAALESGFVGNYAVHGRYEALKAFMETSNSEAAKAQQLAFALIEEVKLLETKLGESETAVDKAKEGRRRLEIEKAQLEVKLAPLQHAEERCQLLEKELRAMNERTFELKKDGAESEILGERLKTLQNATHASDVEMHELRSQLQQMRMAYHQGQVELEKVRMAKEEAEARLSSELASREAERAILAKATERAQSPEGADDRVHTLQILLQEETRKRHESVNRLQDLSRQNEGLQRLVDSLRGAVSPSRRSQPRVDADSSEASLSAELMTKEAEINVLKADIIRLEAKLRAESQRNVDLQGRMDALAKQLRSAQIEMAELGGGPQGRARESPSPRAATPVRSTRSPTIGRSPAPKSSIKKTAPRLDPNRSDLSLRLSDAKQRLDAILSSPRSTTRHQLVVSPPRPRYS